MLFINLSRTFQQIQNVSTHPNTPQFVSRTPYPTTCLFASKITHLIDKYSINIYKKWLTKKASWQNICQALSQVIADLQDMMGKTGLSQKPVFLALLSQSFLEAYNNSLVRYPESFLYYHAKVS